MIFWGWAVLALYVGAVIGAYVTARYIARQGPDANG